MKLKFTTKLFIICCAVSTALRAVQIMFLTEEGKCYLKPGNTLLNIAIFVLPLLAIAYMVANAALATRRPLSPGNTGVVQFISYMISGALYVAAGVIGYSKSNVSKAGLILSLAVAFYFVLLSASALSGQKIVKAATFLPIVYWLYELIVSYLRYTEHSMRVRTVLVVFASVSAVLFFTCVGKILCSVDVAKNYRIMYPSGLLTAILCMMALVPELTAKIFGYGGMVSECYVPWEALAATGIFAAAITLSTFKRSNTKRRQSDE